MHEGILPVTIVESIINLHDIAFFRYKLLLQEGRKVHLADEAYSLGILLVCRGEVSLGCESAHLRLCKVADREEGLA